ncbi:MAG: hypothetical protein AAB539_00965 [Patescibacteria group bacterium]
MIVTLSTHILIAAAAIKPIAHAHPALIFLGAVASHYLSDLIPHWDYKLRSIKPRAHFDDPLNWVPEAGSRRHDILFSGLDCAIGAALLFFLSYQSVMFDWWGYSAIVIGGVFPDGLKGIYYLLKKPKTLRLMQVVDRLLHTHIALGRYPLLGLPFQAVIFVLAVFMIV